MKKIYDAEMYDNFKRRYGDWTTAQLKSRHADLRGDRAIVGATARYGLTQHIQMIEAYLWERERGHWKGGSQSIGDAPKMQQRANKREKN